MSAVCVRVICDKYIIKYNNIYVINNIYIYI